MDCTNDIATVPGCKEQINRAISNATNANNIGNSSCCRVVNGLSNFCWDILFPQYPAIPILLKALSSLSAAGN
ncbi:hypothetical protein LINPERPRIM_LOCUS213 [Linum perenne]